MVLKNALILDKHRCNVPHYILNCSLRDVYKRQLFFCVFGKNPAMMPSNGRKALTWKINSMLVLSANQPKKAEPKPQMCIRDRMVAESCSKGTSSEPKECRCQLLEWRWSREG